MLATMPGRTQGLGLITEPMLRDLQLDRVAYATINLWATLLGAAICLPIGRVFDRDRSPRGDRNADAPARCRGVDDEHPRGRRRGHHAVPAGARHPCARPERAVGGQHHRRRQVIRPQRGRRDGRVLGPADGLFCGGVHRGRNVGAHRWLAHRPGRASPTGCSSWPRPPRCCSASGHVWPRSKTMAAEPSAAVSLARSASHSSLLGLRRRHRALRPRLVGPRTVQRGGACRAWIQPADLRRPFSRRPPPSGWWARWGPAG